MDRLAGTERPQTLRVGTTRLWEIDSLRGVAVVLMIIFHLTWSLEFYGLTTTDVFTTPWQAFARGIGSLFTFLLGVSLTLDAARGSTRPGQRMRVLRRGGLLLGCGMLISLGTYLLFGPTYVRFGILHLLGSSILLGQPFLRLRPTINLALGLAAFALGAWLHSVEVSFPWLIWLGVVQEGVLMVDYYPLLPWAGFALLGIAVGQRCYPGGRRSFSLPNLADLAPIRVLTLLGRHSLLIYLVHMPLIFGTLYLLQG